MFILDYIVYQILCAICVDLYKNRLLHGLDVYKNMAARLANAS